MKRIAGEELEHTRPFFEAAAKVAKKATCHRAQCGSVIVSGGVIIGEGYNSPPLENEANRTCEAVWDYAQKPKYDKTCCVHAEWRAVIDACKRNADKIDGSIIYFMRIDGEGNFTDAGDPYCTVCSRLTMESGVRKFALWNDDGADIYTLDEYDQLSYSFYKDQTTS